MWYTQWKDRRPIESGPKEWEEFKEAFRGSTLPVRRKRLRLRIL